MNPNDRNNEIPPQTNYDFITKDPAQATTTPQKNVFSSKKVIILVVLIFVAFVFAVLSVVAPPKSKTEKMYDNVEKKASQFFDYLANGNTDAAYNMYYEKQRPDKSFFVDNFATPVSKRFKLKQCALQNNDNVKTDTEIRLLYICPASNTNNNGDLRLRMVFDYSSQQLARVEMVTQ